jgi:hypothetical protein
MSKKCTCYDAFNTGRAERAESPLKRGQFKLAEATNSIDRWRDLISTIAERLRTGGRFGANESLGPCMAYERGKYLKCIPELLAHLMGYKILPGIAALEGDGVPKAEVERLTRRAESDAQRLLADCEAARLRLMSGIGHEYVAMKRGESMLSALLDDATSLAELRTF